MPLDPKVKAALARFGGTADPALDPVAQARQRLASVADVGPQPTSAVFHEDFLTRGGSAPLVRTYVPERSACGRCIVYYHGGGWISGSIATHHPICQALASRLGARVVSVDYRLSPESRFPAALEDAWSAFREARSGGLDTGGGPTDGVVVAGDSAGAALAAGVALRARDEEMAVAGQLLVYPVTDASMNTPSYREFATGFGLTKAAMELSWRSYLPDGATAEIEAAASPLQAPRCDGLPPTIIAVAECDPLRDEGLAYAERLEESGVPVQCTLFPGLAHGFLRMAGDVDPAIRAFDEILDTTRSLLARGSRTGTSRTRT